MAARWSEMLQSVVPWDVRPPHHQTPALIVDIPG